MIRASGGFPGLLLVLLLVVGAAPQAAARDRGAVRPGFAAETLRDQSILLIRPVIWVGAQDTGGEAAINAAWTEQARALLAAELAARAPGLGGPLVPEPEWTGPQAALLDGYRALFEAVAQAVMVGQFFPGQRLPTRKGAAFDWTLGSGLSPIGHRAGARFGLFIVLRDAYGSTGRKIFQVMVAGLVGIDVTSGQHAGYAGLVDFETGNLLWLHADDEMGGDVRTPAGMRKRVTQLLDRFPASVPPGSWP